MRTLTFVGILITLTCLVAVGAQFTIPFLTTREPDLEASYGTGIEQKDLDGIIGPEWDDATETEMRLGRYSAKVLIKRDQRRLYVALVIATRRRFIKGFEGYVVFDNGDGRDYSRGDDMMVVEAGNGELVDADYYYRGTYDYRLDTRVGGQCNAYGAGLYDASNGTYVFEFMKDLSSGDTRDVDLCSGCDGVAIFGWASY